MYVNIQNQTTKEEEEETELDDATRSKPACLETRSIESPQTHRRTEIAMASSRSYVVLSFLCIISTILISQGTIARERKKMEREKEKAEEGRQKAEERSFN